MKKQFTIMLLCLLTLAGCDSGQKLVPQAEMANQMQTLQILVNQILMSASHGTNMKLAGDVGGQVFLADATALLRRVMSGPEMEMMHKGGQEMSTSMKRTHALGDAAFDMLGLMMGLTPETADISQLRRLNELLAVAASGNSLLLQASADGSLKSAMRQHAQKLLDQAGQSFVGVQGTGAYHALVGQLLQMLGAGNHSEPDKS
ncbi:MAG: hypothetical protein Q9M08_07330 [Mariprofundus sp.]|nr:hypothetical protein [Mariprofundus sp.]